MKFFSTIIILLYSTMTLLSCLFAVVVAAGDAKNTAIIDTCAHAYFVHDDTQSKTDFIIGRRHNIDFCISNSNRKRKELLVNSQLSSVSAPEDDDDTEFFTSDVQGPQSIEEENPEIVNRRNVPFALAVQAISSHLTVKATKSESARSFLENSRYCNKFPVWTSTNDETSKARFINNACSDRDNYDSSTTTNKNDAQRHVNSALRIPRGGAWYFGKKSASRKYRDLLHDQVSMLDKQLRQSQEELALLRRQLKTSQSLLHRTGSPALRTKSAEQQAEKLKAVAENQELKKRVASLTREVNELEKMRDELQVIIDKQQKKLEELEIKLKEKDEESKNLVARYEKEMEKLKRDIEAKYQQQITDLTKLMTKRVEEAAETARQLAIKEMEIKIQKVTAEERDRSEKLLQEERKRSDAAVEREKVKMRKLAKALFEREKKLNTLDKDLSSMESTKTTSSLSSSSSSKTPGSTYKVDTIRKF